METFPNISPEEALKIYPDVDETTVRASWPSTLNEAVTRLIDDMDDTDKKSVRETKHRELILFLHGWGTGIRNEFGLWRGNTNLIADCHGKDPEDTSMIIVEEVWQRLQKR